MPKIRSHGLPVLPVFSTAPSRAKRPHISFVSRSMELTSPDPLFLDSRVLAIDPGLQGTGVARWVEGYLDRTDVLDCPSFLRGADWATRADYLAKAVCEFFHPFDADDVAVCEMMEFQGSGARGLGWRSGDMQKTTYFTGLLSGRLHPSRFYLVPVGRWKGQLPKRVVQERIEQRLGKTLCSALAIESHAWDAVGIGLWAVGRF